MGINVVQTKQAASHATTGTSAAYSVTFNSPVTSGNAIIVAAAAGSGATTMTISGATDDKSNSYTVGVTDYFSTTLAVCGILTAFNVTNGPQTVTVTFTANSSRYTTGALGFADAGDQFQVLITDSNGTSTSNTVFVNIVGASPISWLKC